MHMGPELFKQMAKVDILHVPFRGAGPALIDVMGGNTHLSFASVPSRSRISAPASSRLGVGSKPATRCSRMCRRSTKSGLPGYEFANWIGIVAPAGTPAAIVAKLHKELRDPELPGVKKAFANEGAEIVRMSSAEYGEFIATETAKWGRVVKEGGIKPN